MKSKLEQLKTRAQSFVTDVTDFPVLPTAATLWERFQQDRLGLTASSLTFTTTLALVPFFAVVLSVFTAFPVFAQMREALEQWLASSVIPASIARNVLDYLTQFAGKASELGLVGFAVLTFTAVSLVLTIDQTLNQIWRVTVKRPLGQRVLVYWAALTLGPLVMGASLAISSYVLTASRGWLPDIGGGVNLALDTVQFVLMTFGLTLLYRFVPNTPVKWKHALAGALFVAVCMALAKWGLGLYLSRIPTYSLIYGAFATVPILLLWIYMSWLIVLFGAVIAAYYVLMSNHLHLLVTPETGDSLPLMMQGVGRGYVRWFNRRHGRSGTLWEGRYRSTVIEAERHLLACMAYIDLNPVRAGMVARPQDYPWSSHGHHIGLRTDPLITPHPLYWQLGNTPFARERAYAEMVGAGLNPDQMTALTRAAHSGWALGGADFIAELQRRTERRVARAAAGRPPKPAEN